MKTFSINTLGCKVNQYESQQIRQLLEQFGFAQADKSQNKADLIVINTCCVTHTASAKSRQSIRKAQKLNPNSAIVVCGCLAVIGVEEQAFSDENIYIVSRRQELGSVLGQIAKTSEQDSPNLQMRQNTENTIIRTQSPHKIKYNKGSFSNPSKISLLTSFQGQTRAFLKIQDGCDGFCSYCIIPKTRSNVHSKPVEDVLEEAQQLVDAGHKEIVLTAVFLGSYGRDSVRRKTWPNQRNDELGLLLEKLAKIPGLARIRLSSLEPADVTEQLINVFCEHHNIMPHLHLSLQSGSNSVLKKMCRQYRIEEFQEKVDLVKRRLDRPALTADLIVGFPGETDADFEQTVDLAREVGFAKMHVFSFSARKGTAAAGMQGVVNNEVIKKRSQRLLKLNVELGREFRRQFIGETATILIENNGDRICGRCERYFMVYLDGNSKSYEKNELVTVKLLDNFEDGMAGEVE